VWPLHVTRRGGSPLHVKIGLAALSAAGAGFAAVKAVALSMPEAGDAEVTMELQKHARRMGIDELVIAEMADDDDSQASQAASAMPRTEPHRSSTLRLCSPEGPEPKHTSMMTKCARRALISEPAASDQMKRFP
jgi:hypothetical protein